MPAGASKIKGHAIETIKECEWYRSQLQEIVWRSRYGKTGSY